MRTYHITVTDQSGRSERFVIENNGYAHSARLAALNNAMDKGFQGEVVVEVKTGRRLSSHNHIMPMIPWTHYDVLESYKQGWSVFQDDQGEFFLFALDDPDGVNADHFGNDEEDYEYTGPVFEGEDRDKDAIDYVREHAASGDKTCRKAIEFLIMMESPDAKHYHLKKEW